jgi:carbamoyl-phosphate synthase large subunit
MEKKHGAKRVLFTGGGGAGTEALSRFLGERYEVHFADADIEAIPYPVPLNRWHRIPLASDAAFLDGLQLVCREIGVDLLIPSVDEELVSIANFRKSLECEVLLPPADFISTHLDKFSSNVFLHTHDLPAPLTERLLERRKISFPCIAKPVHGRGSRGVAVIRSEDELRAHVMLSRSSPSDFIIQELLQGDEFTVMMAANKTGRLCAVVPVRVGVKRGITLRAVTDSDEKVITACKKIHAANPVPGCYNIQLVKTGTGDIKPFEINPRISTTACLGVAAGIDFIDIYLGNTTGNDLLTFRNGLGLRRSWHNEVIGQ